MAMIDTGWMREQELLDEVSKMQGWQKMALMAFCISRMLISYKTFVKQTSSHQKELKVIQYALDSVWQWISDPCPYPVETNLHDLCLNASPNNNWASPYEDHPLFEVSSIACQATALLTIGLPHPTMQQLLKVCSLGTDAVSLLVQQSALREDSIDPSSPFFAKELLEHDLMQYELKHQRQQIKLLQLARENCIARGFIRSMVFGA